MFDAQKFNKFMFDIELTAAWRRSYLWAS